MQSLYRGENIINILKSQYFMWMDGWIYRQTLTKISQGSLVLYKSSGEVRKYA